VAGLADGGYVVVWEGGEILMQRYDATGAPIGAKTVVNSTTADVQSAPAVTALADGGFVTAWVSSGQDGSGDGVYFQRYDAAGQALGAETLINSTIQGDQSDPALSAASDGGFMATWASHEQDGSGWGIYAKSFQATEPAPAPVPPIEPVVIVRPEISAQVSQLYVALFGRAADGEGLAFWAQAMEDGMPAVQVGDTMYATAPAREYYPTGMSEPEVISSFYVNTLGRTPDEEGWAFWTQKLGAPGASPGSVILEIADVVVNYQGAHPAGLESAALFNNRVAVSRYFSERGASIDTALQVLTGVTSDPATVTAAIGGTPNSSDIDIQLLGMISQPAVTDALFGFG